MEMAEISDESKSAPAMPLEITAMSYDNNGVDYHPLVEPATAAVSDKEVEKTKY